MTAKVTKLPTAAKPKAAKPPMKIRSSRHAAARRAMKRDPKVMTFMEMFPPAPPPPGVPENATMAMDDALPGIFAFAQVFDFSTEGIQWPGFPYLAELTQRAEYRLIIETRAKEMTRKGIELDYEGDDEEKAEEKIAELGQAMTDFRFMDVLRLAAEHDGFFGGAHIFIDLGKDTPTELASKLVISKEKIAKGSLKAFRNVEPMWVYPAAYNSIDPTAEDFFRPQTWYVMDKNIHQSRLMTIISAPMPDILKPAYSFRGVSLSQRSKPYVDNFLRTRQSISDITHTFSIIVLMSNLGGALQGGNDWDTIYTRADEFNALRDNQGTFIADKDSEDVKNLAVPLGTLDALQAQAQEQLSGPAQIPLVKLWGITPKGLNASSEGEIRVFYDTILALQEHMFRTPAKVMLDCLQLHLWGEIDEDINFHFVPLWQLDEAGESALRKTDADTDAVYIEAGVISPEDVRKKITSDKKSPYSGLDPDDLPEPPDMGGGEGEEPPPTGGNPAAPLGETKKVERAADSVSFDQAVGIMRAALDLWREEDHPRGQPENAGEFGPGGGGKKAAPAPQKSGGKAAKSTNVSFEVAPDPHNEALTSRWNKLATHEKEAISGKVAARIAPKAMRLIGTKGAFHQQFGGYMGATNPSFGMDVDDPAKAIEAAKLLGFALAQDSMMVVSEKPGEGLEPVDAIVISLPRNERDPKSVEALYDRLFELKGENGEALVGGHTTAGGEMTILNYSGLSRQDLGKRIDKHLGGKYDVRGHSAFAAFPEKADYGYDVQRGKGGGTPLQKAASDLRREASRAVEREIRGLGKGESGEGLGQFWQNLAEASLSEVRKAHPRYNPSTTELYPDLDQTMADAVKFSSWRDWYERHRPLARELYGDKEPLFESFLAAASINTTPTDNVRIAVKGMDHLLTGGKFDTPQDFGGLPAHRLAFEKIARGLPAPGRKVGEFEKALKGDWSAVPTDRHMVRLLFPNRAPSGSVADAQHDVTHAVVTSFARALHWTPTELQSVLWALSVTRQDLKVTDFADELARQAAKMAGAHDEAEGEGLALIEKFHGLINAEALVRGFAAIRDELGEDMTPEDVTELLGDEAS